MSFFSTEAYRMFTMGMYMLIFTLKANIFLSEWIVCNFKDGARNWVNIFARTNPEPEIIFELTEPDLELNQKKK